MPFESAAQERWAHTPAGTKALGGKLAVGEWDAATKGRSLPEHAGESMEKHEAPKEEKAHSPVASALGHGLKKQAKPKHLKTFHAKEQHDGSYHVMRHSGNPKEPPMEHSAPDLDAVHDALDAHMGEPEEAAAPPAEEAA